MRKAFTELFCAYLLYGSGLRMSEALRLRVQQVDFDNSSLTVFDGKGGKDRATFLPESVKEALNEHLKRRRVQHSRDLEDGYGSVYVPPALARKYPNIRKEWKWQCVFAADAISKDPRGEKNQRYHIHRSSVNKAIRKAVRQAGITQRVTAHTYLSSQLCHSPVAKRNGHQKYSGIART